MKKLGIALLLCVVGVAAYTTHAEEPIYEVNLYSSQKAHLIRPILDVFTEQTGIKVNLFTAGSAQIVTKLEEEGELSPADVILTTDIGYIHKAKQKGLLQPFSSKVIEERIPAYLRGPKNQWLGFARRARVIFVRKDMPEERRPKTYEDLVEPIYQDSILVRDSGGVYNQSLLGYIIDRSGKEEAMLWAEGIVANMARAPQGFEKDQLRALAVGEGDVAIANTYYLGLLLNSDDEKDRELAQKIDVIFPNQGVGEGGAHVNIRGGGITKVAKNVDTANALLQFLVSDEAQRYFSNTTYEFPAVEGIEPSDTVKAWGEFTPYPQPLEKIGALNAEAVKIFDQVGWK